MVLLPTGNDNDEPPARLSSDPAPKASHSLPHEILCNILHRCLPPFGPTKAEIRRRRRALRRYALVNSRWYAAALDEAVSSVFINTHANGWTQDEATAVRWVQEAKQHADRSGRGIRTLVVFGEKNLPLRAARTMFADFDKLERMALVKGRNPTSLVGSEPLRQLQVLDTASPTFFGAYPHLTRLDIVDCAGEALPVSLTSTNFPSLETLTLDLVKPRRQKLVDTYRSPGGMTQPPNVRALALRGDGYRFTHELLAAQTHLEHLRLGVSRENTAAYLASLRGSLLSLWVEHSVKDTRDPIGTLAFLPPLDPQTAAHTFNRSSLKHIALSYYDSPDQTVDFDDDWLLSFGRAIAQAMSARGLDLEVRWATDTRKVDEWDPLVRDEPVDFLNFTLA